MASRFSSFIALVGALAVPALVAPLAARAEEVVAREVLNVNATLITLDDAESLKDACTLTPDQFDAAKVLTESARERIATAQRAWDRARGKLDAEDPQDDKARVDRDARSKKAMERFVDDIAKAEGAWAADLHALLNKDQEAGWDRFERHRRRLLIRDTVDFERIDLASMLRRVEPTPSEWNTLNVIAERYEVELDALVRERRPLAKELNRCFLGRWREREDKPDVHRQLKEVAAKIIELQGRVIKQMSDALEEPRKLDFLARILRTHYDGWFPDFAHDEPVRDYLRVQGLSAQQREELLGICRASEQELMNVAAPHLDDLVASSAASVREQERKSGVDWNAYSERLKQVKRTTVQRAYAVLSASQREAYEDGSDPLDGPEAADRWADRRPD